MNLVITILALVLSSDDSDPLIWTAIGAVLGVILFIRGFRALQRKRLIMDTPTAKVRSAAIGLVELQGLAVGPYTITAPLTQVPCYYYQTMLWKWVQRGKNSEWEKVADERMHVPFYLKDSTGMLLVDPNGAEMEIHCDYKQEFRHALFGSTDIRDTVLSFMNRHGVTSNNSIKVEEYCIKPHNAIFVLGTLATNPGLRPMANPMATTAGNFKLGHWTVNLKGMSGSDVTASLMGGGLTGLAAQLALSGSPGTTTTVTSSSGDWGSIKKTTTVTTFKTTTPQQTLQPGDPRAAAAVAAIATKDPALAAKVAAQLQVPYPPPAGALPPGSTVTTAQSPDGKTTFQTVSVVKTTVGNAPATFNADEAHQLAVAAIAAKDPALAAVVATALGRQGAAAAIQKAAGDEAPAAPTGPDGEVWPEHDPTYITKGTHNPAYFISWQSQKDVIAELSRRSVLYIFGGPALTVGCMLYILSRFGWL